MADYKVIHRAEGAEIPWEPGCPVALTAMQVSRNTETSECWLQAKARNVSGADASSIYAVARLEYADGTSEELPVEYLDADVAAGSEQSLKPRRLPRGDVRSCELVVTRVEVQGEIWESVGAASPLPAREKLALPARAAEQRAINLGIGPGDPAAGGKVRDHGGWWACACGQVNVRRDSCCACRLPKAALVANEDEASLLADADKRDGETYAEAVRLQEQGTVESLAKAIEKYESLKTHEGCVERATECGERLSALKDANRKKRTKLGIAISTGAAIAIAAAIVMTQVVIPAQEQALIETEYQYVTEHLSNSDETTYEYLCELKELGYKDTADIYESLYEWHFKLVVTTKEAYEANGFVNLAYYNGSSPLSETAIAVLKCWGGHPGEEKKAIVAFTCETVAYKDEPKTFVSYFENLKGGVGAEEDAYYTVELRNSSTQIKRRQYGNSYFQKEPDFWGLTTATANIYVDGFGAFSLNEFDSEGSSYGQVLFSEGENKITPAATSGTIVASANQ